MSEKKRDREPDQEVDVVEAELAEDLEEDSLETFAELAQEEGGKPSSLADVGSEEDVLALEELPSDNTGLVRYDPLERYLSEIRHIAPLTREEEMRLAIAYREKGDQSAGYRLVLSSLRLVVIVAREYQRTVSNILDLVQEGNIGLLEAVKQFDPYRGIRFPSYAIYWIRAYMLRYIINNLRLVKIGTTQAQRKLFFNLNKEKEKLEAEGFIPEARLLAERLNVKEQEVIEMEQRLALPDMSVDAPVGTGEEAQDMHNLLPSEQETAEDFVVKEQFASALRRAIDEIRDQLDEKELAIIDQRLFTDEPVSLQVIADQFGLSRERIRQIESRLKEKLKKQITQTLHLNEKGEVMIDEAAEE